MKVHCTTFKGEDTTYTVCTGSKAEIKKVITWLMSKGYWFDAILAVKGKKWQLTCGVRTDAFPPKINEMIEGQ